MCKKETVFSITLFLAAERFRVLFPQRASTSETLAATFPQHHLKKMKKILNILLVPIILIIATSSCFGPGIQDYSTELTGNYFIFRTSAHNIIVAPNDGWNDKIAIIPSKVLKVNVYDNFIVAERQGLKRRSPNDSLDSYEIPDEKVIDYWILNTSKNYVIGNLEFATFQKKLDSLHIPLDIELVKVYEY